MEQTRLVSLVEVVFSTAIGFMVTLLAQFIVYPLHGHSFTFMQNLSITCIFTVLSIIRGYVIRRFFNKGLHETAVRMVKRLLVK